MSVSDDDYDFDDLVETSGDLDGGNGRSAAQGTPTMWVGAVCLNFIEHEILEMEYSQPLLQTPPEFVEMDDTESRTPLSPQKSEHEDIQHRLAASYAEHRSIARSLGNDPRLAWGDYEWLCRAEGVTPLRRLNHTIGENHD